MGNQYKRDISPDTEWKAVLMWAAGTCAKQIAHDLKIDLSSAYKIRDKFPLFARQDD